MRRPLVIYDFAAAPVWDLRQAAPATAADRIWDLRQAAPDAKQHLPPSSTCAKQHLRQAAPAAVAAAFATKEQSHTPTKIAATLYVATANSLRSNFSHLWHCTTT
jgi:hypothetical protein